MTARRLLRRRAGPAGTQGMPGPPAVEITARHMRVGGDFAATLTVTGYPAEVSAGWLEPLTAYPGRLDVTLHIEPIPATVAAARLRRQRARLESGRRAGADHGQLDDPGTEAAAADARELAYRLARGEGHLFRLGLYFIRRFQRTLSPSCQLSATARNRNNTRSGSRRSRCYYAKSHFAASSSTSAWLRPP
jgi:hypothetical protein